MFWYHVTNMFRLAQTHPKSTALVGFVLPAVMATVIEYVLTGGTTGVIPIIAALLAGVPTLVVLYSLGAFADQSEPQTDNQIEPQTGNQIDDRQDRYFTPRPLRDLVREQQENTTLIANQMSKRHIGHWKKVEGRVLDVYSVNRGIVIFAETTGEDVRVFLYFDANRWNTKLNSIDKSDVISVIGQIDKIERRNVSLENCELLDVRADADANDESSSE